MNHILVRRTMVFPFMRGDRESKTLDTSSFETFRPGRHWGVNECNDREQAPVTPVRGEWESRLVSPYSVRSATRGSIIAARIAGTTQAIKPTTASMAPTPQKTIG